MQRDYMLVKKYEKELFSEWKSNRNYTSFLEDGIFDEETYNKQDIKILFVLKEADWENGNCDLCEYLLTKTSRNQWRTWYNIVRWIIAIRTGGEYPRKITNDDKVENLKTIAFLNIKKVGGDSKADDSEIRKYGINDSDFIKRQIELYNPDIIICCGRGNGKILHDYILNVSGEWQTPICNDYNYFLTKLNSKNNIPVISFCHPQMRGGHLRFKERYEDMCQIADELRKNKLL